MTCPDWRTLVAARDAGPAVELPAWAEARRHAAGCDRCLAAALAGGFTAGLEVEVEAVNADNRAVHFSARVRLDTPQEVEYYRHGGILQYVLRQLLAS